MTDPKEQQAVITLLLDRIVKQRLPRILEIKERVDLGATLNEPDIEFLEEVLSDAAQNQHYFEGSPDLRDLYARMVQIYTEVTEKALENEAGK